MSVIDREEADSDVPKVTVPNVLVPYVIYDCQPQTGIRFTFSTPAIVGSEANAPLTLAYGGLTLEVPDDKPQGAQVISRSLIDAEEYRVVVESVFEPNI